MMRKICIILLVLIFLSACSKEVEPPKINLVLLHGYGTDSEADKKMRDIYMAFERENPDISMQLISVPGFENMEDKLKDMIFLEKVPNIIYSGGYNIERTYSFMKENDYLLDMAPYLKEDKDFYALISPENFKIWEEGGKLYNISDKLSLRGYWYNRKIFRNAGINEEINSLEDFKEACEKIRAWADRSKLRTTPIMLEAYSDLDILSYCLYDKNGVFKKENIKEGLSFLGSLNDLSGGEQNKNSRKDSLDSFNVAHSAIYVGDISEYALFAENLDADFDFFPSKSGKKPMYSALSGFLLSESSDEKKKEAGIRFIKYMLGEKVQKKMVSIGFIPANPKVLIERDENEILYRHYNRLKALKAFAQAAPNLWNATEYRAFLDNIDEYLSGDIDGETLKEKMNSFK